MKRSLRRVAGGLPLALAALVVSPVTAGATPTGLPAATGGTQAPLTAATARALSKNVDQRVIVVLRSRLASVGRTAGALEAEAASVQRPVLAQLRETHARNVHSLSLVDAVTATVSSGEAVRLRSDPAVSEVIPDSVVPLGAPVTARPGASTSQAAGFKTPAGVCPGGKAVQLNPEAVETIHAASQSGKGATAQALGYTGAGVKVAFIAGGIDTNQPDFIRPNGSHVFVDYQDFSNTGNGGPQGTASIESFLDASSIAAQGRKVYNLQGFGTGLAQPCRIRILGVAPGASLVDINVFGSAPSAYSSTILQGINWAVLHDHVNVLNESFGSNPFPDVQALDLTEQANDAAIARGVTVTVSAGDAGPTNTIGSPASDPAVIDAGASTTFRAYLQAGIVPLESSVHHWLDNNVSALSSGGVTQSGRTVDVLAPGDLNWVLCSSNLHLYSGCANAQGKGENFTLEGGTSEAAPLTAGVAALVIQAYRGSHHGASPSPAVVKQIITSTAENVSAPADQQGAGMLNAYAAVLAARSYAGASVSPAGHTVLTSSDQLDTAAAPSSPVTLTDTLTNNGAGTATYDLSTRVLGPETTVSDTTSSLTGANSYATTEQFTVPAHQARLKTQVAYTSSSTESTNFAGAVSIYLYGPGGTFAANSLPQGMGAHGEAVVADPAPGTWTALIVGGAPSTAHFLAQVATWRSLGTLSPSTLTLAPGASAPVTLTTTTPASPGDESGSILIRNTTPGLPYWGVKTSVAVILRSQASPTSTFTGIVTGGNGRATDTGQSAYYEVPVAAGTPALNASIVPASSQDTFTAELISPGGVAESTSSNSLLTQSAAGSRLVWENGTQLHVLSPAAGTWTLAINFYNRVSGTVVNQPFTVSLDTTAPAVSASGLPDAATTTLPAGTPSTVDVTVTNNGTTPEEYFVDARLATTATVKLRSLTSAAAPVPPNGVDAPTYVVPPQTSAITASATGPRPVVFDYSYLFGDPDVLVNPATPSKTATGTYGPGSPGVPAGEWTVTPELAGPDGLKGYPATTVSTSMTATTAAFDPAVSSPTGDIWKTAVDPTAGGTPYLVEPGHTVTIPVTITPQGPAGTTVSGTLYVDDYSAINQQAAESLSNAGVIVPSGSELAALPYTYTVSAGS